jgi:hypothetical protein
MTDGNPTREARPRSANDCAAFDGLVAISLVQLKSIMQGARAKTKPMRQGAATGPVR